MGRPRVTVLGSASLDGRITTAPGVLLLEGGARWQDVVGADHAMDWLRRTHQPEVVLEGSGSFITDDAEPERLPAFTGEPRPLYQDYLPAAVLSRPGHRGWFTVVDGRGRVRWERREVSAGEWQGWYPLVLTSPQARPEFLAYLRSQEVPYLITGEARVDLRAALEKMGSLLGVTRVLAISPGRLGGALLRAGLVDEVDVELLPAVVGGSETPAMFAGPPLAPARLRLLSTQVYGEGQVWLRYEVVAHGR